MTETVPETDDLIARLKGAGRGLGSEDPHDYMAFGFTIGDMLEAATALKAAQARIAELEARPTIKTHDGTVAVIISDVEIAATARREALEEAANLMDDIAYEIGARPMSSIHSALCEYRKRIRALMEKHNENG